MTDKQIIIDGVDVSGCKCFYINDSHPESQECINPYCKDLCKNNPNCYYKQLKHKEQECEELKNDKFALEVHIDSLTSPVNVEDCEHSVYNGEYIACRYYEGQRCDELDFSNCMFRENVRLKQQLDQLKIEKEEVNKQLQSTKGLVTVGNKQLLDAINAYITVRTTLEEVKIMLQVVTETNNVYPLQTNLLLMLEKIREVIPDEKSLKMECNNE